MGKPASAWRWGLAWTDPQRGISGELKGRSLVTHVDEAFREQGLALSFAWDPAWALALYAQQPGQDTAPWAVSLTGEQQDTRSSASHPEHSLGLHFSLLF